jgi:hypothetical protein
LVDHVPFGQWKTMTFVSALRHDGMVAPMLIESAVKNAEFPDFSMRKVANCGT